MDIRFYLQKGHFSSSIVKSNLSRRPLEKFPRWVRHMLGFPRVRDMLDHAQVTRAIQASRDLFIFQDARGIVSLLGRWCIQTHTFICIWGEFTITLEYIVALLHLPVTGYFPEKLSAEETTIFKILTDEMEEINKVSNKYFYAR